MEISNKIVNKLSNKVPFKFKIKSSDEASEITENIINTIREPLLVLDKDLRVVKASSSVL